MTIKVAALQAYLKRGRMTARYTVSQEQLQYSVVDWDRIIKSELREQIAKHLLEYIPVEVEDGEWQRVATIDCVVLPYNIARVLSSILNKMDREHVSFDDGEVK